VGVALFFPHKKRSFFFSPAEKFFRKVSTGTSGKNFGGVPRPLFIPPGLGVNPGRFEIKFARGDFPGFPPKIFFSEKTPGKPGFLFQIFPPLKRLSNLIKRFFSKETQP